MKLAPLIFSMIFGVFALPVFAFAYQPLPAPTSFVSDLAGILSIDERKMLEEKIVAYNASSSNEFAVVTVKTLDGDTIENYANTLFTEWGIGKASNDNGILILIAISEREVRIEVGYGLEGAVPDALAHQIITKDITPQFKNGNYYAGIDVALDHLILATMGEYVPVDTGFSTKHLWALLKNDPISIIIVVMLFQWLVAILGRTKSWWLGGALGGVVGVGIYYVIAPTLFSATLIFVFLVASGLLFDYVVSLGYSNARTSGATPPWWTGGGGSFGSGGSFGGFGGGSSGGGGASGRW